MSTGEKRTRSAKVTAIMANPICGHVPMLDGVLCSHMGLHMSSIRQSRHGHRHSQPDHHGHENIPIPMASDMFGGWRIPCCSSPIYRVEGEDVAHITRIADFDLDVIKPGGAKKIAITGGEFKSMRLPKRVMVIKEVIWFAIARMDSANASGPGACLRKRLRKIDAIGAKTEVGFGRVSEWQVELMDHDWHWFARDEDDKPVLMRPLPVCDELPKDLTGARGWFDRPAPPYHDKRSACEVVVPC